MLLFMMVLGPSDEELVSRFQSGEKAAYAQLVRRYQHRVFTLCLRWIGSKEVAAEVAQDVFLAVYRNLAKFRGDAKFSTWLYRIATNHCKNRNLYGRRRHEGRHEPLEGNREDDDSPRRQLPSEEPGTDQGAHRSEAEQLIHEGLAQLDDEQRQIIVLRDMEDRSYEEISEILDVPRGTVKSRLHRARAELAKVLSRRIRPEDVI